MTALANDLGIFREKSIAPSLQSMQARPSAVFRPGALVAHRQGSALLEVPLSASKRTDLIICGTYVGKSKFTASASSDGGGGAVDADGVPQMIAFEPGATGWFDTGTSSNEVTAAKVGLLCYAHDDNTLYLTDETNTTSPAGRIMGVAPAGTLHAGKVAVYIPQVPYDWAFEDGADAVANFEALLSGTATGEGASLVGLYDVAALYAAATVEAALLEIKTKALVRSARGVVFNNVADLGAFVVAGNAYDDGLTYVAGNRVLLVGQSTPAQNGLYVVGAVSGTAPLTRATDMPLGLALPIGAEIKIEAGTLWGKSTWRSTATASPVIATNDPVFYPRIYKQTVTLAAGTYKIGFGSTATPDEPLFMLAGASVQVTCNTSGTAGGAPTLTTEYGAPDATRIAGIPGTAVLVINAQVAAGTLNNADTSTLDVLVTNF